MVPEAVLVEEVTAGGEVSEVVPEAVLVEEVTAGAEVSEPENEAKADEDSGLSEEKGNA